jgi:uncharacterized membrane protein YqgA involved in biofilm formation
LPQLPLAEMAVVVAEISADEFNSWVARTVGSILLTLIGIFAIQHLSNSKRNQLIQYVGLALVVLGIFFVPETLRDLAVQIFTYFRNG